MPGSPSTIRDRILAWDRAGVAWAWNTRRPRWLPLRALLLTAYIPFLVATDALLLVLGSVFEVPVLIELGGKLLLTMLLSLFTFITLKEAKLRLRPYADPETRRRIPGLANRDLRYGGVERESFPSGHVYTTGMLLVVLCSTFGPLTLLATVPYALTMAWLRMHLGVHYPTDVTVGFLDGALTALAAVLLYPTAEHAFAGLWASDLRSLVWIALGLTAAAFVWVARRRI